MIPTPKHSPWTGVCALSGTPLPRQSGKCHFQRGSRPAACSVWLCSGNTCCYLPQFITGWDKGQARGTIQLLCVSSLKINRWLVERNNPWGQFRPSLMLMDKIGATYRFIGSWDTAPRARRTVLCLTWGMVRAEAPVLWHMHRERCPLPSLSHVYGSGSPRSREAVPACSAPGAARTHLQPLSVFSASPLRA